MSEPVATPRKYDLYSQATKNDPYPVFAAMQRDDPVFCQAGLDGQTMIWFLTRFEDVQAMLHDATTFVRDPVHAHPEGTIPAMSGLESFEPVFFEESNTDMRRAAYDGFFRCNSWRNALKVDTTKVAFMNEHRRSARPVWSCPSACLRGAHSRAAASAW